MDPCRCHDLADAGGPGPPGAAAVAPPFNPIPAERRSRLLTKAEAARLLGMRGTDKAVRKRLARMIARGSIACHEFQPQGCVFDLDQFPAAAWPGMRPE